MPKLKQPKYEVGELVKAVITGQTCSATILKIKNFLWWRKYLVEYETILYGIAGEDLYKTTNAQWVDESEIIKIK